MATYSSRARSARRYAKASRIASTIFYVLASVCLLGFLAAGLIAGSWSWLTPVFVFIIAANAFNIRANASRFDRAASQWDDLAARYGDHEVSR
jgi:fatty acid desaturase